MNFLDLVYIVLPPGLALAIATYIVWTGNRSTAALDVEIAAYRARKGAEREAVKAADEARVAETASTPVRSKASPPLADLDALLRRAGASEDVAIGGTEPTQTSHVSNVTTATRTEVISETEMLERLVRQLSQHERGGTSQRDITITSNGQTIVVQAKSAASLSTKARRLALAKRFQRFRRTAPQPPLMGQPTHNPARPLITH